jgi:hypothetical protein
MKQWVVFNWSNMVINTIRKYKSFSTNEVRDYAPNRPNCFFFFLGKDFFFNFFFEFGVPKCILYVYPNMWDWWNNRLVPTYEKKKKKTYVTN